jgi:hypothetical protein
MYRGNGREASYFGLARNWWTGKEEILMSNQAFSKERRCLATIATYDSQ